MTALELLIRRTEAGSSSNGRFEVVIYGASNPGVVVTGIPIFVAAVNWFPYEETIKVAAWGLYVGQQHSHGDGKTTTYGAEDQGILCY